MLCFSLCSNFTSADYEGDVPEDEFAENNHVYMGVVGIEDPLRPEVSEALAKCRRAKISVMMCTGDHLDTAVAIAKRCSILDANDTFTAMEGVDFRARVLDADGKINQAEFDKVWPTLRVLARSSPEDKLVLVTGLQNSGLYKVYRDHPEEWGDRVSACPASRCSCGVRCCAPPLTRVTPFLPSALAAADLQGSPGHCRDRRRHQRRPRPVQV